MDEEFNSPHLHCLPVTYTEQFRLVKVLKWRTKEKYSCSFVVICSVKEAEDSLMFDLFKVSK